MYKYVKKKIFTRFTSPAHAGMSSEDRLNHRNHERILQLCFDYTKCTDVLMMLNPCSTETNFMSSGKIQFPLFKRVLDNQNSRSGAVLVMIERQ